MVLLRLPNGGRRQSAKSDSYPIRQSLLQILSPQHNKKKAKKKQEDGNESTKGTESDRNSSDANNEIMVLKQE